MSKPLKWASAAAAILLENYKLQQSVYLHSDTITDIALATALIGTEGRTPRASMNSILNRHRDKFTHDGLRGMFRLVDPDSIAEDWRVNVYVKQLERWLSSQLDPKVKEYEAELANAKAQNERLKKQNRTLRNKIKQIAEICDAS